MRKKSSRKISICFVTFIPMLAVAFMNPGAARAKETIRYVGSSTVGVFIKEAARVYTDVDFAVNTDPESGGGETATAYGKTDIGGVARDVKKKILDKGVRKFLIGKDAIGAWVNTENPVAGLSIDQLKAVFTGKISNWKALGGPDLPIHVYIVNPQSATRKVFSRAVMGKAGYAGAHVRTIRPDPAILDKVAADPSGIGQLSLALGMEHPAAGKVKAISVDGQAASVENTGYPITRPLHLVTKGEPTGSVKAFIDWALSSRGQAVVKKFFVGLK